MKRLALTFACALLVATSLSAHVVVAPLQSKSGATQNYEVRVHNENEKKLATTSVELEVPDGVTIVSVGKPPSGTFKTTTTGARITTVTWDIQIPADKYVALPFAAKNPDSTKDVVWNVRQHMAGGSAIDWSDKPGSAEKPSITKISAVAAPSATH
jgi:uncharacterized protein YcnI